MRRYRLPLALEPDTAYLLAAYSHKIGKSMNRIITIIINGWISDNKEKFKELDDKHARKILDDNFGGNFVVLKPKNHVQED